MKIQADLVICDAEVITFKHREGGVEGKKDASE